MDDLKDRLVGAPLLRPVCQLQEPVPQNPPPHPCR